MNPARYAALIAALTFTYHAGAQSITLVAPGNVPVPGQSFQVHRGAYTAPLGENGGIMDFHELTGTFVNTYHWVAPSEVPLGSQYPEAEFVLTSSLPDTIYYKATAQGLERVGHTQVIQVGTVGYGFTSHYTNPMLDLKLPSTFGDGPWTDLYAGNYEVDGNTGTLNGAITGRIADWGDLIMPGCADTVSVLRVDTRISEAISINVSGFPVDVDHVHLVQSYYPLWGKFPVLRVVADSLNSSFINLSSLYTEWLDATAVGIAEQEGPQLAMHMFPNPANEQATVLIHNTANKPVEVEVVDTKGALVLQTTANRKLVIDTTPLKAGTYHVILTDGQGVRSSRSLIVAH